jgi:hypothetical protein
MSDLAETWADAQTIHFDAIDLVRCFYDPLRSVGIVIASRDSLRPSIDIAVHAYRIT